MRLIKNAVASPCSDAGVGCLGCRNQTYSILSSSLCERLGKVASRMICSVKASDGDWRLEELASYQTIVFYFSPPH